MFHECFFLLFHLSPLGSSDGVILMNGVTIGANARLSRSILAADVCLGSGVTLEPGCVIGSKVKITNGVKVGSGTQLTTAEDFAADGVAKGEEGGIQTLHGANGVRSK